LRLLELERPQKYTGQEKIKNQIMEMEISEQKGTEKSEKSNGQDQKEQREIISLHFETIKRCCGKWGDPFYEKYVMSERRGKWCIR
jgi:hypothetical protein